MIRVGLLLAAVAAYQPDSTAMRKMFEENLIRKQDAQAARDLGFFLKDSGDSNGAAAAFSKALQYGKGGAEAVAGMIALASVSAPLEAETLLRKALASPGMNSRLAVPALSTLGDLRLAAKDRDGAARCWRLGLQHAELVYGKESDEIGKLLNNLSEVVAPAEAVELLERAVAGAKHLWGEQHPETATYEINLARALLKAGHGSEAEEQARVALVAFEATLGPQHPRLAAAKAWRKK